MKKLLLFVLLLPIGMYAAGVLILYGMLTLFEMVTKTSVNSNRIRWIEAPITWYVMLWEK